MARMPSRSGLVPALLALCVVAAAADGCAGPKGEGFAIYLTRDNVPPSQMEMLSHVDIADEPVISVDDIVTYDASTHEMTLTGEAFARVAQLEVPVQGRSFVVCVDRAPLYWGAFWVAYSSLSFDGITIMKPLGVTGATTVRIDAGYPASSFFEGEDPRNDPLAMASLQQAGKLTGLPAEMSELPQAAKGYELYSWEDGGEWHFVLMTGTNRNKAASEVLSRESLVTWDGWVHLHAVGLDAVKTVLNSVPQGEHVFWFSELRDERSNLVCYLPPDSMVDAVEAYALACGLDFSVPLG